VAVDIERVVAAAVESFLHGEEKRDEDSGGGEGSGRHALGATGAVAVGVGIGLAARAVYRRARALDIERIAAAVEDRLKR
jgi:hypothetical protein